jgi:SAM-dependent methyltransferase
MSSTTEPDWSFARYLSAKQSVDDRALNRGVWQALADAVQQCHEPVLNVLEVGCGVGTMADRLVRWGLFDSAANPHYLGIDNQAENIAIARERFANQRALQATWLTDDLYAFAGVPNRHATFDLVIAHAVLDLLDLDRALAAIHTLLKPGGLAWLTINFDGATILEPVVDADFDALVEQVYHRTMDERMTNGIVSGDSRTGRHMFAALPSRGFQIMAAGASDWVVLPGPHGYPADESYFLRFILHGMATTLAKRPEIDSHKLDAWLDTRTQQVANCALIYIAHQLDFLARRNQGENGS